MWSAFTLKHDRALEFGVILNQNFKNVLHSKQNILEGISVVPHFQMLSLIYFENKEKKVSPPNSNVYRKPLYIRLDQST